MKELRGSARVVVARKGQLIAGEDPLALTETEERFPCLTQDISETGLLILSTRKLKVGQRLDFVCELYPKKFLACTIEVVHLGESVVGTRIVDISHESRRLLRAFLQAESS